MERKIIEDAVRLAGLELPADTDYEVAGDEPILASPHFLATGAATARLLTGVAANALWRVRTGRGQRLAVDARHAAASLRSYLHLEYLDADRSRSAGAPGGGLAARHARIGGIVRAGDGRYVQLHPSFNDGPQVLDELGLKDTATAEDVAAAVGRRDALELEDAFIARRICGGMVRTKEEWAAHPQGQAIAGLPAVTITKIGDAPAEPLPAGDRPAAGLRVADLTRVLAGPTAAKCLAEHGGDVLHITAPKLGGAGLFDTETGIGKRQTTIDLDDPGDNDAFRQLLRGADVFSQGYRLGTIARRGFGPEEVAALRPGIVYVSENCYGHLGPWAERPGWEQLAQAATGMSWREGDAAGVAPRLAPAAVNDYTTGFLGAYGAMMALSRRAVEGGSWHVQVSLCQTSMWYLRLGDNNTGDAARSGDVGSFLAEMDTPDFGPIRYLTPALTMSETPPRWDLPPSRAGAHPPVWLDRA